MSEYPDTVQCWVMQRTILNAVGEDTLVRFDLLGYAQWGCSVLPGASRTHFDDGSNEVYCHGATPLEAIERAWEQVSRTIDREPTRN